MAYVTAMQIQVACVHQRDIVECDRVLSSELMQIVRSMLRSCRCHTHTAPDATVSVWKLALNVYVWAACTQETNVHRSPQNILYIATAP